MFTIIEKKMKKAKGLTPFMPAWAISIALFGFGCGGCSSSSDKSELPFQRSVQEMEFDRLWEEDFPGPITDLALARKSGDLVVATIPDPDKGGKHLLTLISKKGKQVFQLKSPYPVKALDIADDGSRVVVSNYEGKLLSYDRAGQVSWQSEGGCRPILINVSKRIVCYHDDDTKPSFAFDVYDFEGKRISRFPIKQDILALKVSGDEKWVAIALAGGRLLVFNSVLKVEREHRVNGEVLDLSISSGDAPTLAAISMDVKKGQTLNIFEPTKKAPTTMRLSYHVEQVETLPAGKLIAVYGNSPRGQYIAVHSAFDATLQWQQLEQRYADYSLAIRVGADRILAGFEYVSPGEGAGNVQTRRSKLVVLDLDGKLRADLPLKTAEGAYLYSFSYSPERSLLGVGTDDKRLQLLELK